MAKDTCIAVPEAPNGEASKLYKDMLSKIKNRPIVNWLYACYLTSDTADKMRQATDANGNPLYKENKQGEFNADDVLKFLNWSEVSRDISDINIAELGVSKDVNGYINYSNAKEALEKADNFNNSHKGLTATVVQHGDNVFNILVFEKNARTHTFPDDIKAKLQIWDVYKRAFGAIGVDIENMPESLTRTFNANNPNLVQHLKNLKVMNIQWLNQKDALLLFNMDANSPQVQRLVGSFGSLEDAAKALDDINHRVGNYTTAQKRLLMNAVAKGQEFQGMDLNALQNQVSQLSDDIRDSSPEKDVNTTLHKLKKKYNIDIEEIVILNNEIKTLSQAAAKAAIQLERKIRILEKQQGNNVEGKRLERIQNQLLNELKNKKYYAGILNFMKEATDMQQQVDDMINGMGIASTEMQTLFDHAKTLMDIKQIKDMYYPVISALSLGITIDESIDQIDIDNLTNTAKNLKDYFDKKEPILENLAESTMISLLEQIVGDTAPDGQSIANVIRFAQEDSGWFDYLYSVGRASNPVIAAMGSIILDAKESRNSVINDVAQRIRKATDKLYKSGSNSEFMYENERYIISDIDWDKYNHTRRMKIGSLKRQGLQGFDFKEALEQWEEVNTENRVVDFKTGRTEKVPNQNFRKAFPTLTQAQLEYYNTMMQIKGEMGTLLPAFAQRQYFAPQVRRSNLDAIAKGDVKKAIKNIITEPFKVREDDTDYVSNSAKEIIDGEEFTRTDGNFDDTPLQTVPIYYINRVEEGELMKDFSSALQHLASSAINYDAMTNVAQVIEFVGDYAKDKIAARTNKNEADVVSNKVVKAFNTLRKYGKNTNTVAIIDGFRDSLLYGEKKSPEDAKWLSKLGDSLKNFTSFKGLAFNVKGAFSNWLVGEFQMMIEAGAGEFYNFKDFGWAHTKLFGNAGTEGEIMELLTNNMRHKSTLMRELFDPLQENYRDKSNQRYYKSMFRQLMGHDCAFIGYGSGEYLIHYVNMYSILHNQKVLQDGKVISLYDAFEVTNVEDGNASLKIKDGVTKLDGTPIDNAFIQDIKNKVKYANQTTHGAMNEEDRGLIHRRMLGRLAMNFRQWMVEHYSRRFRKAHFDSTIKGIREGYYTTVFNALIRGDAGEAFEDKHYAQALGYFLRDLGMFTLRMQSQWGNLNEMQRYNVKRAATEFHLWLLLCGLSFALGEPDTHKKEFWRRWFIYHTLRVKMETEASMPHPKSIKNIMTILQSPMGGITVANSMFYLFFGLPDLTEEIKSGPHKGENKYWRTVTKNLIPGVKDWEQMQEFDTKDTVFLPFTSNDPNR